MTPISQNQKMFLRHPNLSQKRIPIKNSNPNQNRNRILNRKRKPPSPRLPRKTIFILNNHNRLSQNLPLSQLLRVISIFLLKNKNLNLSPNQLKITSLHKLQTVNPKQTDKVQAFPSKISNNQQDQNQCPKQLQTQLPCANQIKNVNTTTYIS